MNDDIWIEIRTALAKVPPPPERQGKKKGIRLPDRSELGEEAFRELMGVLYYGVGSSSEEIDFINPSEQDSMLLGYIREMGGLTGEAVINSYRWVLYEYRRRMAEETLSVDESFGNKDFRYLTDYSNSYTDRYVQFLAGYYEKFNFFQSHLVKPGFSEEFNAFNRNGEIAFKSCLFDRSVWLASRFLHPDFIECTFDNVIWDKFNKRSEPNFDGALFEGCSFRKAEIKGQWFAHSRFNRCLFSEAQLSSSEQARTSIGNSVLFLDCAISSSLFRDAKLTNVYFDGCEFDGNDFTGCIFDGCYFTSCGFEELPRDASFLGCEFEDSTFADWSTYSSQTIMRGNLEGNHNFVSGDTTFIVS